MFKRRSLETGFENIYKVLAMHSYAEFIEMKRMSETISLTESVALNQMRMWNGICLVVIFSSDREELNAV